MNTRILISGLLIALAGLPAMAQTSSSTSSQPIPVIEVSPTAPWSDLGSQMYGKTYEVYIPHQIRSDDPDAQKTYDPAGYPRNGNHMTPEGAECAGDSDCKVPMECFNRDDSGPLPKRVCAFPPPY